VSWTLLAFAALTFGSSCLPVLLARRFVRDIRTALGTAGDAGYRPRVSLIVPCKGLDPSFDVNVRAFLAQDYPALEIQFVTATEADPAHAALRAVLDESRGVTATLLTAGLVSGRSEKVTNQLAGVGAARDTDVLVFMDSDARPEPAFVRHLVQPLADASVGLATGFRWYMPVAGGLWSYLRSAWNGGGVVFLTDPQSNYAWGGAMAIRRETFDACAVADHWQHALSDDMTITLAVRAHGLAIRFVPRCLVVTHEDATFGEMLEWTTRQTIIAGVYHPALWWKIAIAHGVGNAVLVVGLGLIAARVAGVPLGWPTLTAAGLMLAIVPMEMLNAQVLWPAIVEMLPTHRERLHAQRWRYRLLAPAASALALVNTIVSLFTRRITWRGVTYEMRSPTDTVVVSRTS